MSPRLEKLIAAVATPLLAAIQSPASIQAPGAKGSLQAVPLASILIGILIMTWGIYFIFKYLNPYCGARSVGATCSFYEGRAPLGTVVEFCMGLDVSVEICLCFESYVELWVPSVWHMLQLPQRVQVPISHIGPKYPHGMDLLGSSFSRLAPNNGRSRPLRPVIFSTRNAGCLEV